MCKFGIPLRTAALFVFALTLASGFVQAATITANGVDESRGLRNLYIVENGRDVNTYFTGILLVTVNSGGVSADRDALCVDLFTDINLDSTYDTNSLSPSDVSNKNLERTAWLIDNALLSTYDGATYDSELASQYWADDATSGAALQLAIWDITHDGGDGLSTGSVAYGSRAHPANAAVLAAANYYISISKGKSSDYAYVYQNYIRGTTREAQMLISPLHVVVDTPEPATLALAGAALIGLGCFARRKKGEQK
jgi:hypothetical protein